MEIETISCGLVETLRRHGLVILPEDCVPPALMDRAIGARAVPRSAGLRHILAAVERIGGVSPSEMAEGRLKGRTLIWVRRAIWVARRELDYSFSRIGHVLERDHSTVLHHIRALDAIIEAGGEAGRAEYEACCSIWDVALGQALAERAAHASPAEAGP